jgi:hypothetical protein
LLESVNQDKGFATGANTLIRGLVYDETRQMICILLSIDSSLHLRKSNLGFVSGSNRGGRDEEALGDWGKSRTLVSLLKLCARWSCPVYLLDESMGAGGCLESAGMLLVS